MPSPSTPDVVTDACVKADALIRHEEQFRARSQELLTKARQLAEAIQQRVNALVTRDDGTAPAS